MTNWRTTLGVTEHDDLASMRKKFHAAALKKHPNKSSNASAGARMAALLNARKAAQEHYARHGTFASHHAPSPAFPATPAYTPPHYAPPPHASAPHPGSHAPHPGSYPGSSGPHHTRYDEHGYVRQPSGHAPTPPTRPTRPTPPTPPTPGHAPSSGGSGGSGSPIGGFFKKIFSPERTAPDFRLMEVYVALRDAVSRPGDTVQMSKGPLRGHVAYDGRVTFHLTVQDPEKQASVTGVFQTVGGHMGSFQIHSHAGRGAWGFLEKARELYNQTVARRH